MPTRKLRGPCPAPTKAPTSGKPGVPMAPPASGREHREKIAIVPKTGK